MQIRESAFGIFLSFLPDDSSGKAAFVQFSEGGEPLGKGEHFGIASACCLHHKVFGRTARLCLLLAFPIPPLSQKENHDKCGSWFTSSSYPHIDLGDTFPIVL